MHDPQIIRRLSDISVGFAGSDAKVSLARSDAAALMPFAVSQEDRDVLAAEVVTIPAGTLARLVGSAGMAVAMSALGADVASRSAAHASPSHVVVPPTAPGSNRPVAESPAGNPQFVGPTDPAAAAVSSGPITPIAPGTGPARTMYVDAAGHATDTPPASAPAGREKTLADREKTLAELMAVDGQADPEPHPSVVSAHPNAQPVGQLAERGVPTEAKPVVFPAAAEARPAGAPPTTPGPVPSKKK